MDFAYYAAMFGGGCCHFNFYYHNCRHGNTVVLYTFNMWIYIDLEKENSVKICISWCPSIVCAQYAKLKGCHGALSCYSLSIWTWTVLYDLFSATLSWTGCEGRYDFFVRLWEDRNKLKLQQILFLGYIDFLKTKILNIVHTPTLRQLPMTWLDFIL